MGAEQVRDALRQKIFAVLAEVTGGCDIDTTTDFTETGMTSIEYLELVEKIETTFDVVIDLEADGPLTRVENFLDVLLLKQVIPA